MRSTLVAFLVVGSLSVLSIGCGGDDASENATGSGSPSGSAGSSAAGNSAGGSSATGGSGNGSSGMTGKGGTSAGGTSAGGTSAGGTSAGGQAAGGEAAGGSGQGGEAAGGSGQGGEAAGGTGQGGEAAGGTGQGGEAAGGTGQGGEAAGGSGQGGEAAAGAGGEAQGGQAQGGQAQGGATSCTGVIPAEVPADPCDAYAEAICGRYDKCSPLLLQVFAGTLDLCKAQLKEQCAGNVLLPGQMATIDDVRTCAGYVVAAPCECALEDFCPAQPVGTLANDTACLRDNQCQSGYCDAPSTQECGACKAAGLVGDDCAGGAPCRADLRCDATSGKCEEYRDVGGACTMDGDECQNRLVCLAGVCAEPLGAGEDCSSGDGLCNTQAGLFCGPVSKTCDPFPVAAADGECGLLSQQPLAFAICPGHQYCSADIPQKGTCLPRVETGGTCISDGGLGAEQGNCVANNNCVNGTCVEKTAPICQ